MSIVIRPSGEAAAAATTGAIIGAGERAKEERARAERKAARAAQQRERQLAREWEMQKFLMRSQQDFAHEQRMIQVGLDKEARAREWEVEKAEILSRIDLERDEKERSRKLDILYNKQRTLQSCEEKDEPEIKAELEVINDQIEATKLGVPYRPKEQKGIQWWMQPQNAKNPFAKIAAKIAIYDDALITDENFAKDYPQIAQQFGIEPPAPEPPEKEVEKTKPKIYPYVAAGMGGYSPNIRGSVPSKTKPIIQRNKRTGQERISYDGGQTWQMK